MFGGKKILIILASLSLFSLVFFGSNPIARAASNYPAYKFPWRAGEIWQQRPYDIHRDAFGLALDFVPVRGTVDVVAMAPGQVTRGCTTRDGLQTVLWIETISRGIRYGERVGYFHLNPDTLTVESGDMVRRGEVIGTIALNIKDYSDDPCNLMSWYEPHLHVSLPESAFPINIDGQIFEAPESEVIFSGPLDKDEEIYRYTNFRSTNSLNGLWNGLFRGAKVRAANATNLRSEPSGSILTKIASGSRGQVISGPVESSIGNTEYTWWQIEWDNGSSGWHAQDFLQARQVVAASSGVNVRRTPAGDVVGKIMAGQYGVLASGVVSRSIDGQDYDWIAVHWNDGSVGWSVFDPRFVRVIN